MYFALCMEFTMLYIPWFFNFLPLFRKNTSAENHCKNKDPCQNDRIDAGNRFLYPAVFGVWGIQRVIVKNFCRFLETFNSATKIKGLMDKGSFKGVSVSLTPSLWPSKNKQKNYLFEIDIERQTCRFFAGCRLTHEYISLLLLLSF